MPLNTCLHDGRVSTSVLLAAWGIKLRRSSWCRRDLNQNVSTLLDELDVQQRPISAPPHLDDRWAQLVGSGARRIAARRVDTVAAMQPCRLVVHQCMLATPAIDALPPACQGQLAGTMPEQKLSALADIRLDEDYDRFYQAQIASGKKLPPPLDNRTLYQDLPQYQQQPQFSPELAQHLLQQQQRATTSPAPSNGILAAAGAFLGSCALPLLRGQWALLCLTA
jgi:hypothetical protein